MLRWHFKKTIYEKHWIVWYFTNVKKILLCLQCKICFGTWMRSSFYFQHPFSFFWDFGPSPIFFLPDPLYHNISWSGFCMAFLLKKMLLDYKQTNKSTAYKTYNMVSPCIDFILRSDRRSILEEFFWVNYPAII